MTGSQPPYLLLTSKKKLIDLAGELKKEAEIGMDLEADSL